MRISTRISTILQKIILSLGVSATSLMAMENNTPFKYLPAENFNVKQESNMPIGAQYDVL